MIDSDGTVGKAGPLNALPSNHSPECAPVLTPTQRTGIETMLAAAGHWRAPDAPGQAP